MGVSTTAAVALSCMWVCLFLKGPYLIACEVFGERHPPR